MTHRRIKTILNSLQCACISPLSIVCVCCAPVQNEFSISVLGGTDCSPSRRFVMRNELLDLVITNECETEKIIGIDSIENGRNCYLIEGEDYEIKTPNSETLNITIFENIIKGDIIITLKTKTIEPVVTHDVFVQTSGVVSSIEKVAVGESVITTLSCTSDEEMVGGIEKIEIGFDTLTEDDYYFNYEKSELTIPSNKIIDDIYIYVTVINKYHNVNLIFAEGQEDFAYSTQKKVVHEKKFNTQLILTGDRVWSHYILDISVKIGEMELPKDQYMFSVDDTKPYMADLSISNIYTYDDVNITMVIQEKVEDYFTVVLNDGTQSYPASILTTPFGFKYDFSLMDNSKYIKRNILRRGTGEGREELVENKDYTLTMREEQGKKIYTLNIEPRAITDDFELEIFLGCESWMNFEDDSWDNLSYYAKGGWEHFTSIYGDDFLGRVKKVGQIPYGGHEYSARVIAQKWDTMTDTQEKFSEGSEALLTFQFTNMLSRTDGSRNGRVNCIRYSEENKKDTSYGNCWATQTTVEQATSCIVRQHLSPGGNLYNDFPEWMKNDDNVRSVKRWYDTDCWSRSPALIEDKFFILGGDAVNQHLDWREHIYSAQYGDGAFEHQGFPYPYYDVQGDDAIKRLQKLRCIKPFKEFQEASGTTNLCWGDCYWLSSPSNLQGQCGVVTSCNNDRNYGLISINSCWEVVEDYSTSAWDADYRQMHLPGVVPCFCI